MNLRPGTARVLCAAICSLALAAAGFAGQERADVPLGPGAKAPGPQPPAAPEGGPANDDCAAATVVTGFPFNDSVDTTGSSTQAGEPAPSCTTGGASVWYTYTNNTSSLAYVTASSCGSGFDTVLDAFTGTCGDLAGLGTLACNDDSCGFQSNIGFNVDPGQTVLIRASGFAGATGQLALSINADFVGVACPAVDIVGALGSGSPDYPGTSGTQNARLNRNGIASSCNAPKACNIFAAGTFNYDAYTIPNDSGGTQCIQVALNVLDQAGCNLQSDAYLNGFDDTSICTNYLADAGVSSGIPPTQNIMTVEVPANDDLVVVVHSVNVGELGCNYELSVVGDLCQSYVPPIIQEIPTLDRYGMALLVLLVGAAGLILVLRRRI